MDNLLFLLIGGLLTLTFTKKPLLIQVHHVHEDVKHGVTDIDIDKLEEDMFKEDPKKDDLYDKLDETIAEINNIMGGSDR